MNTIGHYIHDHLWVVFLLFLVVSILPYKLMIGVWPWRQPPALRRVRLVETGGCMAHTVRKRRCGSIMYKTDKYIYGSGVVKHYCIQFDDGEVEFYPCFCFIDQNDGWLEYAY